jgi:hypothetical protein
MEAMERGLQCVDAVLDAVLGKRAEDLVLLDTKSPPGKPLTLEGISR